MGYRLSAALFLMCACFVTVPAQTVTMVDGHQLQIEVNPKQPTPPTVQAMLSSIGNYRVYEAAELEKIPDEVIRISAIPDAAMRERELAALADKLRLANLLDTGVPPECEVQCTTIKLRLKQQFKQGTQYIITVGGVKLSEDPPSLDAKGSRITQTFTNTAAILPSIDAAKLRDEVRVVASVPLRYNSALVVESKHLELSDDKRALDVKYEQHSPIDSVVRHDPKNELTIKLDKRLDENTGHTLEIRKRVDDQKRPLRGGLFDGAGNEMTASGSISVAGLPSAPDNPKADIKVSGDVGAHQKPVFDLKANFAPVPVPRSSTSPWTWSPTASLEIGLGNLKSTNSIILDPFRFARYYNLCRAESLDEETGRREVENRCTPVPAPQKAPDDTRIQIPNYYQWAHSPWSRLSFIKLGLSPLQIEADRAFSRINTVAGARFDFEFSRLLWSIQEQRALLEAEEGVTKEVLSQIKLERGFKFVPYVSVDFGGHVTTEKIEKDVTINNVKQKQTVFVPKHAIARGKVGTTGLFQWRMFSLPMSLTFDEHLLYLALEETIGFTNDNGAFLKPLRGFHHRGTASWDIFLDPAKHYSFNVSYENGRKAPNFEYLNKFTTGIKVVY